VEKLNQITTKKEKAVEPKMEMSLYPSESEVEDSLM
jgi:hypothetical protein